MVNKKEFLLDKLNNLINWLKAEVELKDDSTIIIKLKAFSDDYNSFLQFLLKINSACDSTGSIADNILSTQLNDFKIDYDSYSQPIKDKFKRFIKCFCLALRT